MKKNSLSWLVARSLGREQDVDIDWMHDLDGVTAEEAMEIAADYEIAETDYDRIFDIGADGVTVTLLEGVPGARIMEYLISHDRIADEETLLSLILDRILGDEEVKALEHAMKIVSFSEQFKAPLDRYGLSVTDTGSKTMQVMQLALILMSDKPEKYVFLRKCLKCMEETEAVIGVLKQERELKRGGIL